MTPFDQVAQKFDEIAAQLDAAARHGQTAGEHFRTGEVPRGSAHALALEGHIVAARRLLEEIALTHSQRARP